MHQTYPAHLSGFSSGRSRVWRTTNHAFLIKSTEARQHKYLSIGDEEWKKNIKKPNAESPTQMDADKTPSPNHYVPPNHLSNSRRGPGGHILQISFASIMVLHLNPKLPEPLSDKEKSASFRSNWLLEKNIDPEPRIYSGPYPYYRTSKPGKRLPGLTTPTIYWLRF